jgi:hypothetical protein
MKEDLCLAVTRCISRIEDMDEELKVKIAISFIRDAVDNKDKIATINENNYKSILKLLCMQSVNNLGLIKLEIADIIINENLDKICGLLTGQLHKYVARASGVNESIFMEINK